MADAHPAELSRLFTASDPPAQDAAWTAFLATHSRLLLHTARLLSRDYDAAMDGYTYIIEALRSDDYRRLRAYSEDGRGKFTTWLVVVARRLCLDFHRRRYGRAREVGQESRELRAARRRLVDLVTEEIDTTNPLASGSDPAMELHARTQTAAVEETVRGLPGRDRLLLALRFEEDLPAPEIARIMGYATPFHVYRRLKVVLAELRAALRRRGVDEAC